MAKEVLIREAQILELFEGEFVNENNEKQSYFQFRVFQPNQQSDFMTVVKLKLDQLKDASALVGKTVNLLTEQKSYQGKISYHFASVV